MQGRRSDGAAVDLAAAPSRRVTGHALRRELGGLGQGQQLVAVVPERLLDPGRRPLGGAGPGLIAEGFSKFLGLGEELSDAPLDRPGF